MSSSKNIVKDVLIQGKIPTLGLVMMVKNEHARIEVSLDSVNDIVDCFIILDTGSEDNTVEIIKNYCTKNNKLLHLIQQKFSAEDFNFSTARNVLLDFADDKSDYLLLLDCNDELRGGADLRKFVNSYTGLSTAFHICQEWWNGQSLDKYFNIRLVKSNHLWRYNGAIHEYIMSPEAETQKDAVSRVAGFTLYQDRTKDDDKSFKRFNRDEKILNKEYQIYLDDYIKDPSKKISTRNLFYYGQTCMCLGKNEKAYKLYKERSEQEGFTEERYHAYFRCGELSKLLEHDWEETMTWYIKAYEYSTKVFDSPRAEPLFRLAEHYRDKCWDLCYMYLRRCCEVVYPDNAILFVDRRVYDYSRWHLLGIVGFYAKQIEMGKIGCLKAIQSENQKIDNDNLLKYVKDKKEANKLIKNMNDSTLQSQQTLQSTQPTVEIVKQDLQNKLQNLKDKRKKK
jgi:glycosyltransferase involved in cell wall biosynthesis